ncbi:MAG: tetratricopeptide repeat protein [candidate division Zixibacteria bacterium]|nr:tetratricopeptide repeat protein [Candidatus Tariuqbacter arcticus]
MQGARRKITKKELKEDKLVTYYYKTRTFLDKHGKAVIYYIAGFVALIIIVGLVINSKIQANKAAGYQLYQSQVLIDRSEYQEAVNSLNLLIDTYPGTRNSTSALVTLARTYYQMAEYDSTIQIADRYIVKYRGKSSILTCTALALKAAALEQKAEFKSAAEMYAQAAHSYPDLYTAPIYLIDAGRCYNLSGEDDKAIEIYEEVLKYYSYSDELVNRANEQLARAGGVAEELALKLSLF